MQTTHAKAIKYLGIATIVLAALTLLGCLVGMIGMAALGSYIQNACSAVDYGYGYGHHGMMSSGSYSDVAGIMLGTGIANALFFWKLACAVVALIAGIVALRLKDAMAHNLRTVFIWALVAAICSLLAGSFITMTLLIIIAVFAEMDRKALEGGAAAAPAAPATPAPANSAYVASYGDTVQPVAASAVAAAVAAPVSQAAGPAVAENQAISEEATAAAVTYEEGAAAVIETAETKASAAAATAENAHIAEEGQAAADFYQDNAEAVIKAANAAEAASFETNPTAPAAMEAQGEAEELKADVPVAGVEAVTAPETVVEAAPAGESVVAEAEYVVETTAPAAMEAQGEAEELKADEAVTKQQDSPEQL